MQSGSRPPASDRRCCSSLRTLCRSPMIHRELHAELRDRLGEQPLRSIATQTDADRIALAVKTGGQPRLDVAAHSSGASTPFIDYLNADILHTLQQPRSEHPD